MVRFIYYQFCPLLNFDFLTHELSSFIGRYAFDLPCRSLDLLLLLPFLLLLWELDLECEQLLLLDLESDREFEFEFFLLFFVRWPLLFGLLDLFILDLERDLLRELLFLLLIMRVEKYWEICFVYLLIFIFFSCLVVIPFSIVVSHFFQISF